jgi:hypothetical protein
MPEPTGFHVFAKNVDSCSLPKIDRFYNGRHHTTVLRDRED